ncbi:MULTISPECIES: bifunctional hydroxymethylpyrimidine kinase/phosphomethylpyrimidine kinase [unclassified Enterococcus]|uniref:bifunctional hydroxymethylpyrimidine kinase/phosphomethylpyrimidine kinase n=1 Tax=unclassified Enterococcus TaxID=2608891 RepID=UPI001552766D|nr:MULTISPECIES: bifunctional hydroxymethylpyrimidine kinase/phosphomethylpyrimidine kinase [unclassified Enterococcus]MBS7577772.1 bifunctional hydroxymethylpyrimidine kinase/phosphomethylpyrimidine kinase [Enterococcus sp. MMGLQ5-2]MBS7585032.1 bifunctional hydroxymethylpyrimidine kinase/phosphomethylpyrimidine kinase [Enterococcus sp. MMGLQ5-1]NPD12888.1 bifunctional hydroxymethylpyrimidine kinase/phosphomethylpyrimidine kinase [Enterococcus sp. MMGLQ5-1]NPD37602.1 bifunctional hydroxymethyl
MKYILTIAGSDTLSGGGLQTDLATFKKNKLFGFVAITSIVTMKQSEYQIHPIDIEIFKEELETLKSIPFAAIKIGLLPNIEMIQAVAKFLNYFPTTPIILDPVLVFKEALDQEVSIMSQAIVQYLLPRASIITPNLKEAEIICQGSINNVKDMENFCKKIVNLGVPNVLLKGGNRLKTTNALDLFYDGQNFNVLQLEKIPKNANGSGCMLAADIASSLAINIDLNEAVKLAKNRVFNAIKASTLYGVAP